MAWQTIGTTELTNSNGLMAYCYLQYDDSNSNVNRDVRIRVVAKSGSTYWVDCKDVTVEGDNHGTTAIDYMSEYDIWTGSVAGGRNISGSWRCDWYASSGGTRYYSISGYLPSGASAPSGATVTFNSATWDSINITSTVSSWGTGYSGTPHLQQIVCLPTSTSSNWYASGRQVKDNQTTSKTSTQSVTNSNSTAYDGGLTIKGASSYKVASWGSTSVGHSSAFNNTVIYTPPAPLQSITKTETPGNNYISTTFTITGGTSTNNSNSSVQTQFRWSDGNTWTNWTNVGNAGTAWTAVTTVAQNVPYESSITVQARQVYQGQYSEVKEFTYISDSATPPSDLTITVNSKTWNSANLTGEVGDYGIPKSLNGRQLHIGLAETASVHSAAMEARITNVSTNTATVDQNSSAVNGGLTFKGMMTVYPYTWANNTKVDSVVFGNAEVLPPAPGQLSYSIDPTDESKQTISYVGVAANNITNYDPTLLKRTIRYEDAANPGVWTYVINDVQTALTATTTQLITIPGSHTYNVEAWMTYDGVDSQKSIVPLTNTQDPKKLYCSVYDSTYDDRVTKTVEHLYGAVSEKILASIEKDSSQTPPSWLIDVISGSFCDVFNNASIASLVASRQALQEPGARIRDIEIGYTADGYYLRINVVSTQSLDTFYIGEDLTAEELLDLLDLFAIRHNSYDPVYFPIPANDTMDVITTLGDGTGKVTKKIKKLYASVNGVAKLIHEDI